MVRSLAAGFLICVSAWGAEFSWRESGAGLAMFQVTNSGPVVYTTIRVERRYFEKDLSLTSTLASNTVVGLQTLSNQLNALPKESGAPVAAMNADFFMMSGAAKGDPRGLQILHGELISVPTGPAAFWQDLQGKFHGEPVSSKLAISWPGGGTHLAGLNEQLDTNELVLFTPRMGTLYDFRAPTNRSSGGRSTSSSSSSPSDFPKSGPIRPPGGREWTLEHSGSGPWLPLRVGHTYRARTVASSDGFTNVPPDMMLMSLGSNLVARLPALTNGTPVTISVATAPDLTGVQTGLGTGPMLVHEGKIYEVTARMSEQLHPRSALGWNERYLYLAVADGRQPGLSVGIQLSQMAKFMIDLGCDEVINMDGGLSTTLMLNGAVINHPSNGVRTSKGVTTGGYERDIANAIVILRKRAMEEETDQ
ncbi:MAG TPA: phosphodiester glycosidase family protein [Verrucomicrobiae bacterium]